MKTIEIKLPDKIASQVNSLVQEGWFTSENEVVLLALAEFIRSYHFALQERFQLEDIAWALQQRAAEPV